MCIFAYKLVTIRRKYNTLQHAARYTARNTGHAARYAVHGTRCTLYSTRYPLYAARHTMHAARCTVAAIARLQVRYCQFLDG